MEPRTGLWPLAAPGMSMAYSSKRESPVDVPCQLRSSRGGGEAWLTRERLERLTKRTIWRGTGGLTHGAWTRLWHDGPRTREPPQRCERCSRAVPAPKAPKLAHLASDLPSDPPHTCIAALPTTTLALTRVITTINPPSQRRPNTLAVSSVLSPSRYAQPKGAHAYFCPGGGGYSAPPLGAPRLEEAGCVG